MRVMMERVLDEHRPELSFPAATDSPPSSSSLSKRRRTADRRVVSVPLAEAEATRGKGAGECAPPLDSWAWRKYGQKPIKGSPYPRGYYRCSSSKGCPARKQVERSRVDPAMLVITYASDHNHPWPPLPRNRHPAPLPLAASAAPAPAEERNDKFPAPLILEEDFSWFSESPAASASPPPAPETLLCAAPMYNTSAMLSADGAVRGRGWEEEEEGDDSLFAGLGELPEFTVVFRREMPAPAGCM